jgi:hypothetical protein
LYLFAIEDKPSGLLLKYKASLNYKVSFNKHPIMSYCHENVGLLCIIVVLLMHFNLPIPLMKSQNHPSFTLSHASGNLEDVVAFHKEQGAIRLPLTVSNTNRYDKVDVELTPKFSLSGFFFPLLYSPETGYDDLFNVSVDRVLSTEQITLSGTPVLKVVNNNIVCVLGDYTFLGLNDSSKFSLLSSGDYSSVTIVYDTDSIKDGIITIYDIVTTQ